MSGFIGLKLGTEITSQLIISVFQWMFLQLNPSWDGPIKQLLLDADAWLCKRRSGTLHAYKCSNTFLKSSSNCHTRTQRLESRSPFWTRMTGCPSCPFSDSSACSTSLMTWPPPACWNGTTSYRPVTLLLTSRTCTNPVRLNILEKAFAIFLCSMHHLVLKRSIVIRGGY